MIGRYLFDDKYSAIHECAWRETVVGVSACQLYVLAKSDVLKMPPNIRKPIHDYLLLREPVETNLWSQIPLRCVCVGVCVCVCC